MAFTMRQSHLATFSRCPLSAQFELVAGERYSPELNRGTLAHRVVEECFRTMYRTGEPRIEVDQALEVMWEVLAQRDVSSEEVLTIPPEERLNLRQFVVRFASDYEWEPTRILTNPETGRPMIEERLHHTITCEDGVERTLTGSPDVVLRESSDGIVVVDFKSGWGPPKAQRGDQEVDPTDKAARRYLTERGHYQLDAYGLLALSRFPRAQTVTLWEIHPRSSEDRKATLDRDELHEVERQVGVDLMLMDRGVSEGTDSEVWKPVPGTKQCGWCVNRKACPKATEALDTLVVLDAEQAADLAGRVEAVTPYRTELIDSLKAWVDANGPVPLPDGRVLGWHVPEGKSTRRFEAHVLESAAQ